MPPISRKLAPSKKIRRPSFRCIRIRPFAKIQSLYRGLCHTTRWTAGFMDIFHDRRDEALKMKTALYWKRGLVSRFFGRRWKDRSYHEPWSPPDASQCLNCPFQKLKSISFQMYTLSAWIFEAVSLADSSGHSHLTYLECFTQPICTMLAANRTFFCRFSIDPICASSLSAYWPWPERPGMPLLRSCSPPCLL